MTSHHPSDALLLDYASGGASQSVSLLVATHLALCPICRQKVSEMETLGGALMENETTHSPLGDISASLKARLMDRLDEPEPIDGTPANEEPILMPEVASLPQPLRGYCAEQIQKDAWRWSGFGIKKIPLLKDRESFDCYLLSIKGGSKAPTHDHRGDEWTLVLSGGFTDRSGHFLRGDVAEQQQDDVHQPIADPGEPCVCLIVAQGPVKLTGTLGRFLNPLIR
jgi:putative transcriptional regulator